MLTIVVGVPMLADVAVGVTGAIVAREGSVTALCTGARSAMVQRDSHGECRAGC
jgi:hypothetical protein